MSRKSEGSVRLETLDLMDYPSDIDDSNAASIPHHDSMDVAPSSQDVTKSKKKSKSRRSHRTRAYKTLTGSLHKSQEESRDRSKPQQHPSILRPGCIPSTLVHGRSNHGSNQIRGNHLTWTPKKPVYVQHASSLVAQSGFSSFVPPLSRYNAYQPPSLQEQLPRERDVSKSRGRNGRHRPSNLNLDGAQIREDNNEELRSNHYNATYSVAPRTTTAVPQNAVPSSRVTEGIEHDHNKSSNYANNHTSSFQISPNHKAEGFDLKPRPKASQPTTSKQQVKINTSLPPALTSPTFARFASSIPPSESPASALRRTPSPARGSWTSDTPRQVQERPPLAVRAREHLNKNLYKAGRRPRSSFIVNGVTQPEYDAVLSQLPSATPYQDSSSGHGMMAFPESHFQEVEKPDVPVASEVEVRKRDDSQRYPSEHSSNTSAPESTSMRQESKTSTKAKPKHRPESLFLDDSYFDNPGRHTFFPSEWSRRERVLLEQEKACSYFVPLPTIPDEQQSTIHPPLRNGFGWSSTYYVGLGVVSNEGPDRPGTQYSWEPFDDRDGLPSRQYRMEPPRLDTLPQFPPLCETPGQMAASEEQLLNSQQNHRGNTR